MKIQNIHKRTIAKSLEEVGALLETISSDNDKIWPHEEWTRMILDNGLNINSKGGHGPIKYYVSKYVKGKMLEFTFIEPKEYEGTHTFEIIELPDKQIEISHIIDMEIRSLGIFTWFTAVRWLHDALIEDCFDKVEGIYSEEIYPRKWNMWVKILRSKLPVTN